MPADSVTRSGRSLPGGGALISAARCVTYNQSNLRAAVQQCIGALPDLQRVFAEAERVLLKPNVLSSWQGPEAHVNTHPGVVRALGEILIADFGCRIAIGDSCGSLGHGSTARALERSGMEAVAGEIGAEVYNVDQQPRRTLRSEGSVIFKDIPLPANLDRFDLIVSVAKLKTHLLTYMTGAVKNLLGLVPGAAKKNLHLLAPRPDEFATALCDLYAALPRSVAVIDGVVGMEGRGPSNGALRRVGLVAAGADPVAVDSFCAQVMGFAPLQVPLLARCAQRGLGVAAPEEIQVVGEPAAAFAPTNFARPPTYAATLAADLVPRWLVRRFISAFNTTYARINQDICRQCGECERNCPSKAIFLDEESRTYHVNRARCISCYCCAEVCPHDAVEVAPSMPTRIKEWIKGKVKR